VNIRMALVQLYSNSSSCNRGTSCNTLRSLTALRDYPFVSAIHKPRMAKKTMRVFNAVPARQHCYRSVSNRPRCTTEVVYSAASKVLDVEALLDHEQQVLQVTHQRKIHASLVILLALVNLDSVITLLFFI
jgi:hypothetical protein